MRDTAAAPPYCVNGLVNSSDPNYSDTLAVNSIDSDRCRSARGDNLFQDDKARDKALAALLPYSFGHTFTRILFSSVGRNGPGDGLSPERFSPK